MNYKKILIDKLNSEFSNRDIDKCESSMDSPIVLINTILENLYYKYLKLYNSDQEKAYDKFITEKVLQTLNIYVEDLYLIDKNLDCEFNKIKYRTIRKDMRRIVHFLYEVYHKI